MNDETQASNFTEEDFKTVDQRTDISTEKTQSETKLTEGISTVDQFVNNLKQDIPFANSVIAVIGYITIASFGHMSEWQDLFQYITLLVLVLFTSKFSRREKATKYLSKNVVPWIIVGILVGVIFLQNYEVIINIVKG